MIIAILDMLLSAPKYRIAFKHVELGVDGHCEYMLTKKQALYRVKELQGKFGCRYWIEKRPSKFDVIKAILRARDWVLSTEYYSVLGTKHTQFIDSGLSINNVLPKGVGLPTSDAE